MKKYTLMLVLVIVFTLFITGFVQAQLTNEEIKINKCIAVLEEMASRKDQAGAFSQLLGRAEGIVIYPRLVNIGLGWGAMFGDGVVLRKDRSTQEWYGPAFIELKTASVGLQIGIQEVSLVLVVMDDKGMEAFKSTDFEIGADISIAPGPLGDSLQTDIDFNDSIYTYSYSKGLYAGFALKGSMIHADTKANKRFYEESITCKTILDNKKVNNETASKLVQSIEQISQ
jgi:lipid-binding SYLF domain-containing protein